MIEILVQIAAIVTGGLYVESPLIFRLFTRAIKIAARVARDNCCDNSLIRNPKD